jgi:hypothetical protein
MRGEIYPALTTAEVQAIAKRLEARDRLNPDRDIRAASCLLRILVSFIAVADATEDIPADPLPHHLRLTAH